MTSNPTPGLLYVTMQPKETLPLAEFHDWYNNEHGQMRLRLPQVFTNGLRYRATDLPSTGGSPQEPEWLAMYDVTDVKYLTQPVYTSMRANSTAREKATISRVDVGRHRFDLVSSREKDGFVPLEKTDFTDVDGIERNGKVLVAVGMKLTSEENAEEEFDRWYETEHIPLLMKIPGWLRTRRYKTSHIAPEDPIQFVALHEYENVNGLGGLEHQAAMNTPWRNTIREKYVASMWRRTYSAYYVFGPAPRDLSSLSQHHPTAEGKKLSQKFEPSWENLDKDTRTWWIGENEAAIESFITTPDGIKIPYRLEGSPDPKAPTILFSNSLLTDWTMWDPFLSTPLGKSLIKTHRILRYNTRGRSDLLPGTTPVNINVVTDDIHTLLNHLRVSKLKAIIGVSLGGVTVLNFTLKHPALVEKFIACDFNIASSPANIEAWESRIRTATGSPQGMQELAGLTADRWFLPSNDSEIKQGIRKMVGENSVPGFVEGVKALYHYDLRKEAAGCKIPALLIVGAGDGALPKAIAGFKGDIGGGEKVELRIVEGAGHLPMVERADGFADAVGDFLA